MKIFILSFLLLVNSLLAEESTTNLLLSKNTPTGCTIPFFQKKEPSCSTKVKKTIPPENIKIKLTQILKDVKTYKKKTHNETEKLLQELNSIKKKFRQYKITKNKELHKVNTQLRISNKKISKIKKKIAIQEKKTVIPKHSIKKTIVMHKTIRHMEPIHNLDNNLPWIEITVENNINIYDLALQYYGDAQEYKKIYTANQHIISSNFQINNGMSLKIPMTTKFEEQPIFINSY